MILYLVDYSHNTDAKIDTSRNSGTKLDVEVNPPSQANNSTGNNDFPAQLNDGSATVLVENNSSICQIDLNKVNLQ